MPDFFIVGAPRCGTAFMHHYLRAHPQVFMPATKEPHYFARDLQAPGFVRRREDYLSLFAPAGDARRVGEASVWYLYSQVAARLIRQASPAARAIVMLRDPIELMRSLHARNAAFGNDDIADFEAAVAAEPERAAGRRLPSMTAFPEGLQYTSVARLGEQVARLLESFPRPAVHFMLLEDVAADRAGEYAAALRFLAVDEVLPDTFDVINPNRQLRGAVVGRLLYEGRWSARGLARRVLSPRRRLMLRSTRAWRAISRASAVPAQRPALAVALRDELRARLSDDVRLLSELTGRDLAARWWGDSPARDEAV